jgi:hypothetical protein
MNELIKIIDPSNQNLIQKIGLFTSLAVAAICIFLHFPFEGYKTDQYVTTYHGRGSCPRSFTMEELKVATAKEISNQLDGVKKCQDSGEFQTLPLYSWASKAPIVQWFSTIGRTAISCIFIFGIGVLWLYIFRGRNNG